MGVHNDKADMEIVNSDIPVHEKSISFNVNYTTYNYLGKLVKLDKSETFVLQSFKLPLQTPIPSCSFRQD